MRGPDRARPALFAGQLVVEAAQGDGERLQRRQRGPVRVRSARAAGWRGEGSYRKSIVKLSLETRPNCMMTGPSGVAGVAPAAEPSVPLCMSWKFFTLAIVTRPLKLRT